MKSFVLTAAILVLGSVFVQPVSAAYSSSQRASIRSMPITQRPDRPGHFYGNTVRALNRMGRR